MKLTHKFDKINLIMSSPWAKIVQPEPVNFQDIMSEQVAADFAKKEEEKLGKHSISEELEDAIEDIPEDVLSALKDDNLEHVDSDAAIARMLQAEFDREYDEELKRNEDKYNKGCKVGVSLVNYRRSSPSQYDDDDELTEEEIEENKAWDRFEAMEKEVGTIPPCGYKVNKDGNFVTKHDTTISGRKNACKMLSFPPGFHTGDGENFDMQLSNKVYNSLRKHSQNAESKRRQIRDKKEDRATAVFGLDESTTLLLYSMISNQLLEAFNGVISIGKEAVIVHADGCPNCEKVEVPKECVIKIFKTTKSEFKHRDKYIKDDHRFKERIGKQTIRKTIHIWAEKEMANLYRLQKAGIPCPQVVMLKEHVLVMSFIGENHVPARKLKEAAMDSADYILAYDQVVNMMKTLYQEAKLIHADLSEYNILWFNDQCYIIDVSQAVEPIHENAFHFLFRDCKNITNFFERKLVPGVATPEELFESITGCSFENKEELSKLQLAEKPKPHTMDRLYEETLHSFEKIWQSFTTGESVVKKEPSIVEPPKA